MFIVLVLATLIVWLIYSWITVRPKNFPPGPPCLPIVGSAPWIEGRNIHLTWEKWRELYGPVIGIILGNIQAVAIVGAKDVLQVLKHEDFQGRQESVLFTDSTFDKRLGVFMTDGPYWVEQRRFALRHLKEFGFGKKSMEGMIVEEANQLLSIMKKGNPRTVQVNGLFAVSVINVLWSVMSGTRYDPDDAAFISLLEKLTFMFRSGDPSASSFINVLPRLRFMSSVYRQRMKNVSDLHAFVRQSIREHESSLDESNPRDFFDVYLREMNQAKSGSTFTEESLISVCMDLFAAGAESVTNTLGFALMYLILYQDVQDKIHAELDAVVGRNRQPSLDDRQNLPYVEAVLLEVMRCNTIAPLAAPHRATKDITFNGYNIPKDTVVFVSLWSCLQDREHWGDPENFRPSRHLDSSGKLLPKDEYMVTFGTGKRVCLGEALARNTLFLFFTTVMQELRFDLPEGHSLPDTMCEPGFTVAPKPFEVRVSERK